MGPLILLFWTSGDVSSRFQSQSGQPYSHLTEAYMCGDEPGTLGPLVAHLVLHSDAYLTELTWHCLYDLDF